MDAKKCRARLPPQGHSALSCGRGDCETMGRDRQVPPRVSHMQRWGRRGTEHRTRTFGKHFLHRIRGAKYFYPVSAFRPAQCLHLTVPSSTIPDSYRWAVQVRQVTWLNFINLKITYENWHYCKFCQQTRDPKETSFPQQNWAHSVSLGGAELTCPSGLKTRLDALNTNAMFDFYTQIPLSPSQTISWLGLTEKSFIQTGQGRFTILQPSFRPSRGFCDWSQKNFSARESWAFQLAQNAKMRLYYRTYEATV